MIAVIGDIHGCYNTLLILLSKIKEKYPNISIYSTGDIVDRGNFAADAFELVVQEGIKFPLGNHEFMMKEYFEDHSSYWGSIWQYNGHITTIQSYQSKTDLLKKHLEIIQSLPLYIELDNVVISHAGISSYYEKDFNKDVGINSIKGQLLSTLNLDSGILWTRQSPLLNIGKLQVVGHSPLNSIHYDKVSNCLYIDTGAYGENTLSAVIIDNGKRIDSFSIPTLSIDTK